MSAPNNPDLGFMPWITLLPIHMDPYVYVQPARAIPEGVYYADLERFLLTGDYVRDTMHILMHLHITACLHPTASNRLIWYNDVRFECSLWRRMYEFNVPVHQWQSCRSTVCVIRFMAEVMEANANELDALGLLRFRELASEAARLVLIGR